MLLGALDTAASSGATWHVPSQCPTIQAGIDSSSAGDTVLVASGTYYEHDIGMKSGICLRSETGLPECVTVDATGGIGILCVGVDSTTSVVGLTITGGFGDLGGGMWCDSSEVMMIDCRFIENQGYHGSGMTCWNSSPTLIRCRFLDNGAEFGPAGIYCLHGDLHLHDCHFVRNAIGGLQCSSSSASLVGCTFYDNSTPYVGGAINCNSSSMTLTGCTLTENMAIDGGAAVFCRSNSIFLLQNTVIAFSQYREAIQCEDGTSVVTLSCCDVYGNEGGDWVDCIAGQEGVNGNFSADPLFCDPANGDFTISCDSPCAPGNHPDGYPCGLVGALDVGCDSSATERTSWGRVKAMYR